MAKRGGKPYRPGRGMDWAKVKCINGQEFVVAGYTKSDVVARHFSSLILALHECGSCAMPAMSGPGFTHTELPGLRT